MAFVERGIGTRKALSLIGLSPGSYYRKADGLSAACEGGCDHVQGRQPLHGNGEVVSDIRELLSMPYVDYGYRKVGARDTAAMGHQPQEGVQAHARRRPAQPQTGLGGAQPSAWLLAGAGRAGQAPRDRHQECLGHGPEERAGGLHGNGSNTWRTGGSPPWTWSAWCGPSSPPCRKASGSGQRGQFVAHARALKVNHEFIRPATPQQNAHRVLSLHHAGRAVARFEFESIDDLKAHLAAFREFYNHHRIHSATLLPRWSSSNGGKRAK